MSLKQSTVTIQPRISKKPCAALTFETDDVEKYFPTSPHPRAFIQKSKNYGGRKFWALITPSLDFKFLAWAESKKMSYDDAPVDCFVLDPPGPYAFTYYTKDEPKRAFWGKLDDNGCLKFIVWAEPEKL